MISVEFNNQSAAPYGSKFFSDIIKVAAIYEKKITGTVEVNIVESGKMKELNRIYRGKNSDTDVLSFPWRDDKIVKSTLLGEIYLSSSRIKRQAKDFNISAKEEMARMFIHGLLHLVGHDHGKPREAKKMFALQEKILQLCRPRK